MSWLLNSFGHMFAFQRAVTIRYTFVTVFLPALSSFYVMAVLVQLPHTRLYRAALLPVVFWLALRAGVSLDFSFNNPGYAHFNEALALAMFTIAMRSTVWVLAKRTYTRLPICKSGNGALSSHGESTQVDRDVSLSVAMWNAWDLMANHRGIGWIGPQKVYTPKPYFKVESRPAFFFLCLSRVILFGLIASVLSAHTRSFGPDTFATSKGGSIFDPSLPPLERYRNSTMVTLMAGLSAYLVVDAIYYLHAALYTLLFQQYPSQWPPLFDSPWLSTSLASLWGRRWHQLFREPFVVLGSRPMETYFGRVGAILGAFAVSGILHDVGTRGMMRGTDTPETVGFFLLHGVGIVMEQAWTKVTGRRVGGVVGWFWVFSWLLVTGNMFVNAWARRGLLASEFY